MDRRLKDRTTAGLAVLPFLREAYSKTPQVFPSGKTLSVHQMSEVLLPERKISEIANFESRVWRPSLPVLHLCAAWVTIARDHYDGLGKNLELNKIIFDREILALWLDLAEAYVPLLERSRLNVAPDQLIRFEMGKLVSK